MTMAGKRGRPKKHYETSWGEVVQGLYKGNDGRWRIIATGERFREPDERLAVQHFRRWEQKQSGQLTEVSASMSMPEITSIILTGGATAEERAIAQLPIIDGTIDNPQLTKLIPTPLLWQWLRELLIKRPAYIAQMVGIPQIANLAQMDIPKSAIKLALIKEQYLKEGEATDKAKAEAINVWDRFINFTGATTLADLTQEKLMEFKASIEADKNLKSTATRRTYYARIKAVISSGLNVGMDTKQISDALARCKVLRSKGSMPSVNPKPIAKDDFQKLMEAGSTNGGFWRAVLLASLNLCMYLDDVCNLQWDGFDLKAKTYSGRRKKTGCPRVAVLWDETIDALKSIERKGQSPFVFTSRHGTAFNTHGLRYAFNQFRTKAKVAKDVKFNQIRDGAYTAACEGSNNERGCRVLAGHKAVGLMDNYVLRSPQITADAVKAIHKVYFE